MLKLYNDMKRYVSDARMAYEDKYHGVFSKLLAEFAISLMKGKGGSAVKTINLEDFKSTLNRLGINIEDKYIYTSWYLYNMAIADYSGSIKTIEDRMTFVKETLFDPDCCPEAVLECFVAKMCVMGIPVFWENYL